MLPSLVCQAREAADRESPGTSTGNGQVGLQELQRRGLEPKDTKPYLCNQRLDTTLVPEEATAHSQGRKTASDEPSPFCQLPCFSAEFLFLHLITAEAQ